MKAAAAIAQHHDWEEALAEALAGAAIGEEPVDLAVIFASAEYQPGFSDMIAQAQRALNARVLIGCSGQGIIGPSKEVEGEPALAIMALSLPEAVLTPLHLTQRDLEACESAEDTRRLAEVAEDEARAWFLFADPFTIDAERLLDTFSTAYPGTPLMGGMASGNPQVRRTQLFLNGQVVEDGAVALALGGPISIRSIVSQGCNPIGRPWTITEAEGQIIASIAGRPALDVLMETVNELPPDQQERAQRNLLVGLAMDEYRDDFGRGDFLIRNLIGADRERGAIAVSALPRAGQTIQFQLRDAAAADEDLRLLLEAEKAALQGEQSLAALLWSCNGRGVGLFGGPDHDAKAVAEILGSIPLAGFFCNGEIGPVGSKNFLHGFTASMALFTSV